MRLVPVLLLLMAASAYAAAPTVNGVVKLQNSFNDGFQLRINTTGLTGGLPASGYFMDDFDKNGANDGDDLPASVTHLSSGFSPTITVDPESASEDARYDTSSVRGDVAEVYNAAMGGIGTKRVNWGSRVLQWYVYFWHAFPNDKVIGCGTSTKDATCAANFKTLWFYGDNSTTNDMVVPTSAQSGNASDPGAFFTALYGGNDLNPHIASTWHSYREWDQFGNTDIGKNDSANASSSNYHDWTNITENWHWYEAWAYPDDGDHPDGDYVTDGDFPSNANWTEGTGWTISGGAATHSAGSAGNLDQTITPHESRDSWLRFRVSGCTAGTVTPVIGGTSGTARCANSETAYTEFISAGSSDDLLSFQASSDFNGTIDNVEIYVGTKYAAMGNGDGTNATESRSITRSNMAPYVGSGSSPPGVSLINYMGQVNCNGCEGTVANADIYWLDKVYVALGDNAAARVMIGEESTYTGSAHLELQWATSWDTGSQQIVVEINSGSFTGLSDKYLFVCNELNECSAGFALSGATNNGGVFLLVQ